MGDRIDLIEPATATPQLCAEPVLPADDLVGHGRTVVLVRFVLGIFGLFVSTVVASLAVIVLVAASLPGLRATVVTSGSMEPAIKRGDVVMFKRPSGETGPGTVVVFTDPDGRSTVHRTIDVADDGSLTTKGDANRDVDPSPVAAEAIDGEGVVLVPWIGLPRAWWAGGNYATLLGAFTLLGLALIASRWASDSIHDPWRSRGRTSPAESWIGRTTPQVERALVPVGHKASILGRARACD